MREDNGGTGGAEGQEWYTGMCRKETGNCSTGTGFFNEETNMRNYHNTIGCKATKSVKGPSKDEVQNRVPLKLMLEILEALPE